MLGPDTRASALVAVLIVTWVAVGLLVLIVASLHARLRALERGGAGTGNPAQPYSALLGRRMSELVGSANYAGEPPRLLLMLSATCTSCRRLLTDLADPSWTMPTAVAWIDGPPAADVPATVLTDGARIAAELGVRVTPFGLFAGDDGRVTWAGPVTSLGSLTHRDRSARVHELSATGERQP